MRFGAYEVGEELGRGGTGVVYRARSADGRDVAVKILRAAKPEDVLRFERERALHASLGGADGFVPLLDAGVSAEGGWFIVTPYIGGGTLRQRLRAAPLPVDDALALARRLATALGRAHRRGIVHRDIKPENILFTTDGEPLIADLGLARQQGEDSGLSRTGEGRGTVAYVAPEQASNAKKAGPQVDVFALAVILYEALTAQRPYQDQSTLHTLARAASGIFTPARELRPDVPPWLDAVISRCLAVDPAERPADGEALARALSPPAPPPRPAQPPSRVPVLAAFALGGSLGAIVVGALALAPLPGARPRTTITPTSEPAGPTSSTPPPPSAPPATEAAPVAAEPVGERLAAPDGAARIDADLAASKRLRLVARAGLDRLQHTSEVDALAVSDDLIYAADDHGLLRVWRLADGEPVATTRLEPGQRAASLVVDPLDSFIAWVSKEGAGWFFEGGAWRSASAPGLDGRSARCLATSADGRLSAVGHDTGAVEVAAVGRAPLGLDVGGPVTALAFSPEGTHLATATAEGRLAVWSASTGALIRRHSGAKGPVRHLLLDAAGQTLTAITEGVGVVTWSAQSPEAVVFTLREPPRALGLDAARARVVVVTDAELLVTDLVSGQRITGRRLPEPCRAAAVSPDGALLVTSPLRGGRLTVLDVATGVPRPAQGGATCPVSHIVEVGPTLVTGSEDGAVRAWDARGRAAVLARRAPRLTALAADAARGRVIAGWADGVVQSHALADGRLLVDLKMTAAPVAARTIADGRVLVLERNAYVEELPPPSAPPTGLDAKPNAPTGVWLDELDDGRLVSLAASESMGAILGLHHTDGRSLQSTIVPTGRAAAVVPGRAAVVLGALEGMLRLRDLDLRPDADVWALRCHTARVSAIALSPDGALGISGGLDATLCLWEVSTGRLLEGLVLKSSVDAVTALRWGADRSVWVGTCSGLLLKLELRQ